MPLISPFRPPFLYYTPSSSNSTVFPISVFKTEVSFWCVCTRPHVGETPLYVSGHHTLKQFLARQQNSQRQLLFLPFQSRTFDCQVPSQVGTMVCLMAISTPDLSLTRSNCKPRSRFQGSPGSVDLHPGRESRPLQAVSRNASITY